MGLAHAQDRHRGVGAGHVLATHCHSRDPEVPGTHGADHLFVTDTYATSPQVKGPLPIRDEGRCGTWGLRQQSTAVTHPRASEGFWSAAEEPNHCALKDEPRVWVGQVVGPSPAQRLRDGLALS